MSQSQAIVLLIAALLIIAGLLAYLGYLLYKIRSSQQETATTRTAAKAQAVQIEPQQLMSTWRSLNILARSILAKQVSLTESSIRISALLNYLSKDHQQSDDLQIFFHITAQTAHIPQFDGWIALESDEKRAFQDEMDSIEHQAEAEAERAARFLVDLSNHHLSTATVSTTAANPQS